MKFLNKKNIYPLVYGIFGSLGLVCYVNVFCMFNYKPSEHPYSHPFCIIAGSISLILCIIAFFFDINVFIHEEKKIRRLFTEFVITVISFLVFILVWKLLYISVSNFIAWW